MDFELSIKEVEGKKVINFANNTKDFVEVVLVINGKETKTWKEFSPEIKGHAYPPKLDKPIKKDKKGNPLEFDPDRDEIIAYVFEGEGKYKEEDIEKPAFLRHKMVDKIIFKRTSNEPIKVIKLE